jgi:taurine dioxygenase
MYAAYESLSDRMKAYLDGLTRCTTASGLSRALCEYGVADKPAYPSAEHPVVRTHPVTARRRSTSTAASPPHHRHPARRERRDAGLSLQHCENPLFQCRFRWTENAIAFWDNRCAQHRAMWDLLAAHALRHARDREGSAGRPHEAAVASR